MTPAGVVITLAILAATFAGGWLLGTITTNLLADRAIRRHNNEAARFLAMTAAMRRMSGGGR